MLIVCILGRQRRQDGWTLIFLVVVVVVGFRFPGCLSVWFSGFRSYGFCVFRSVVLMGFLFYGFAFFWFFGLRGFRADGFEFLGVFGYFFCLVYCVWVWGR